MIAGVADTHTALWFLFGDPRLSLEERYASHAGYVQAVASAARKLEKRRLLLEQDVQRYIDAAEASDVLR